MNPLVFTALGLPFPLISLEIPMKAEFFCRIVWVWGELVVVIEGGVEVIKAV